MLESVEPEFAVGERLSEAVPGVDVLPAGFAGAVSIGRLAPLGGVAGTLGEFAAGASVPLLSILVCA
jgi:hypothetical protein